VVVKNETQPWASALAVFSAIQSAERFLLSLYQAAVQLCLSPR
jgi:hypothetical protein